MINYSNNKINPAQNFISNEYLTITVDYHKSFHAFARRPITTYLIDLISRNTLLSIGQSFVLINFFFLIICGIALFYLSNTLLNAIPFSYISVVLFYLSFTILFAFFPTIYSYDEPIQYFLIFISLIALLNEKWTLYVISFSLSLITRESGLVLLPSIAIFLFSFRLKNEKLISSTNLKNFILLIFPVIIYLGYLFTFIYLTGVSEETKTEFTKRLSLFDFNFQDQRFAIESIFSIFLTIGFSLYILFWYTKEYLLNAKEYKMVKAFLLSLIINTILVLTTAQAREARLFALPLIFIWPLLGKFFYHEIQLFKSLVLIKNILKNWAYMSFLLMLIFISSIFRNFIFHPTGWEKDTSYQDEYFLILLILISIHFVAKSFALKKRPTVFNNLN